MSSHLAGFLQKASFPASCSVAFVMGNEMCSCVVLDIFPLCHHVPSPLCRNLHAYRFFFHRCLFFYHHCCCSKNHLHHRRRPEVDLSDVTYDQLLLLFVQIDLRPSFHPDSSLTHPLFQDFDFVISERPQTVVDVGRLLTSLTDAHL